MGLQNSQKSKKTKISAWKLFLIFNITILSMKKIIVIIGSTIGLLGIFAGLIDQTMGWWEFTSVSELFGTNTNKTFLSPFGNFTFDYQNDVIALESKIMVVIAILVILGNIGALVGSFMDKKMVVIIGASIVALCLLYFLYALGNFEQITDFIHDETKSAIFGKETISFVLTFNNSWRLGNGYFITLAGSIATLVGLGLKD